MAEERIAFLRQGTILRGTLHRVHGAGRGIVMAHGFGRSSKELKYEVLAQELAHQGIASLRFDFTGWGDSEGDLLDLSIERLADDLWAAREALVHEVGVHEIGVVAHSLGACAVVQQLQQGRKYQRTVFIAPALNQYILMRYWFARRTKPDCTLENCTAHFDGQAFREYYSHNQVMQGKVVGAPYLLAMAQRDFFTGVKEQDILHIHGTADQIVPLKTITNTSVHPLFRNHWNYVLNGDHDLEQGPMLERWLPGAVRFLAR